MKHSFLRSLRGKLIIGLALAIVVDVLVLSLGGAAATDTTPCDQSAGPAGCLDISLSPANLTADIYVGDTRVATGISSGRVSIKPYSYVKVVAKNAQDGSTEDGDVYTFSEASNYVYLFPGQVAARTFAPPKTFLKGFLTVSCSAAAQPGESLACRPSINGAVQADIVPGTTATYELAPGVYGVHIDLVGDAAPQWSPGAVDNTVTILAGLTQTVSPAYVKQNLITLTLDQPGVYGDFYVNGQLVATQAPTTQAWLPPYQTSVVEARNITDPQAVDYKWADNKTSLTLTSGEVKVVQLALKQQWRIGWVDVGCNLTDLKPENDVVCTVIYDGQPKLIVNPLARAKFTAEPGPHTLTIVLEGSSASRWNFAKVNSFTVVAGETYMTTIAFPLLPPSAPRTSVLSGVTPELRAVYLKGLALGNDPHSFSKIGDCETYNSLFLQPISNGNYSLGSYTYLGDVIPYFGGSYSHVGQAAINGLQLESILDPFWSDKNACTTDQSPLACEYHNHKPVIALVMVRTGNYGNGPDSYFDKNLRKLVQESLDDGVIPVLSTLAYQGGPHPNPEELNATIRQVSIDLHVPLWDFWATTETLPNRGVDDTFHLTEPPNDNMALYFVPPNLDYGMTRRNLEALQVLHELLNQVILGH